MSEKILLVDIVEDLIEKSESFYLSTKRDVIQEGLYPKLVQFLLAYWYRVKYFLYRCFQYPFLMVLKGADFAMRELIVWCVTYLVLGFLIVNFLDTPQLTNHLIPISPIFFSNILIFIPLCVALFLPPSIFTKITTDRNIINNLLNEIDDFAIASELSEVFTLYKCRVEKRVLKIKQLVGLMWFFFLYNINELYSGNNVIKLLKEIFSSSNVSSEQVKEVFFLIVFLLFVGLCIFFVHAYEKSCLSIMNNVQVALIEANRQHKEGLFNK